MLAAIKKKFNGIFNLELSNYALDVRSLGLFRIFLGFIIIIDIISFAPYIDLFYTDGGVLPTNSFKYKHWYDASIHALFGGSIQQIVIFIIHGLAAMAVMLGVFPRISILINFVLLLSLHHRFPAALNGGDSLLGLMLLWSLFLPLNGAFTVFKKTKQTNTGSKQVLDLSTFAFCLQIGLVYTMTIFLKNNHSWLYDADALFYALNLTDLIRPIWAGSFGEFTATMKFGAIATMVLEIFLGFAIMWPWRNTILRSLLVGSGLIFHAGIFLIMDIGSFPLIDMVAFIPFIPSAFWDRFHVYNSEKMAEPHVNRTRYILQISKNALIVLFIYSSLISNLKPYFNQTNLISNTVCSIFDLHQNWNMFSEPSKTLRWIDIIGMDKEDDLVKIEFPHSYISDQPPTKGTKMYKSYRMRKYIYNISNKNFGNHRNELLKWLCQNAYDGDKKHELDSVSIMIYKKDNNPFIPDNTIQVDTLASYCCSCNHASKLTALEEKERVTAKGQ